MKKFILLLTSTFCLVFENTLSAETCNDNCYKVCDSCCNPGRFFGGAGLLYWQAGIGDIEFVGLSTTTLAPGPIGPAFIDAKIDRICIDYEWNPGVRAYLGYTGCSDCDWRFSLEGNYLSSKSTKSVAFDHIFSEDSTFQKFLIPLLFPAFIGNGVEAAKASWKLKFGTLDLIAARRTFSCSHLTISPNFGLRGVRIEQNYDVDYFDSMYLLNDQPPIIIENPNLNLHSCYSAIGFRAGSDFTVPLCGNFSIIGDVTGSLVYGRNKLKEIVNGTTFVGIPIPTSILQKSKCYQLSANFESELGLLYSMSCGCYQFDISLSYFFGIWFDQNHFFNAAFTVNPSGLPEQSANYIFTSNEANNLQLQGLVAQIGFFF